jgi:hypothetical protein
MTAEQSRLCREIIARYPDSRIAKLLKHDIELGAFGHTTQAIYEGNLEVAFGHADVEARSAIEQVTGITYEQVQHKYWNVPASEYYTWIERKSGLWK